MTARIVYRRTHLVLSLVAGLWLAASGIAGSLLVFGDALDPLIHRDLYTTRDATRRTSIDAVIVAAERATGGVATRVRLSGDGTPVHEVWIDCDDCVRVWVDPSTATVNGVRSAHGTTRLFLHELHRRMMLRGAGDIGALIGGAVLILIAITGLVLGWRGGFRLRTLSNYELHRVIGLFVSPMFLVAGATGIYFIQAGLKAAPPPTAKPVRIARAIEPLMQRARAEFPHAEMTWLSLAGPQVMVRFRQNAEAHPNGRTFVRFDAARGERVAKTDALAADARTRFLDNLYPLHIGATGGIIHKLVLVAVGLTPAFFLVTGLILCSRRWMRSWRRRSPAGMRTQLSPAHPGRCAGEESRRNYVPATDTLSNTSVGVRIDE